MAVISDQELLQVVVETKGTGDVDRLEQALNKLATAQVNVSKSLDQLASAQKRASSEIKNSGRAILEASYAIEDAQYGLSGVLNNLPRIVQSLGGTTGLAGVLSIVAVGVNVLVNNWSKLMDTMSSSAPKTAAEQMKQLAENTARTAAETQKLIDLEAKQKKDEGLKSASKSLSGELNPYVEKSQKAVKAAIASAGVEDVSGFDRIKQAIESDPAVLDKYLTADDKKRLRQKDEEIKASKGGFWNSVNPMAKPTSVLQKERNRILQTARSEVIRRGDVGNEIASATSGDPMALSGLLNRIGDVRARNKATYGFDNVDIPSGLEDKLKASTPEAIKKKEAEAAAKKKRDQMQADGLRHDKILEDANKAEKEAEDKAIKEREKFAKEQRKVRVKSAEDRIGGGMSAEIERGLLTAELGGAERDGSAQQMLAKVSLGLMKQAKEDGRELREDEAHQIATKQVKDAQEGLDRKVTDAKLNPEEVKPRKSEVFDATELAARIQSSFGTDNIPRQQLDRLKSIDEGIKALAGVPAKMSD